jgi:hypothetical protein
MAIKVSLLSVEDRKIGTELRIRIEDENPAATFFQFASTNVSVCFVIFESRVATRTS